MPSSCSIRLPLVNFGRTQNVQYMYIHRHARGERDRETEIKRIKIYKTKTYKWDDQIILYTAQEV